MDTLAFGYILPTTGRIRDFNPLETCAARRTIHKTGCADIKEAVYEEAVSDGFWYPSITAGKRVCCGEKFGVFEAYADGKRTELCAKFDGVVLYHTTALGVRAGEALAAYGKI